jgi:hypothetical protein
MQSDDTDDAGVKHQCPECDYTPPPDAEYPEDRLIDHYDTKHGGNNER